MNSIPRVLTILVAAAVLLPAPAYCAEPEKVVVRNRLFTNEGKFEAGATVGLTPINYLVRHTNLTANLAYNLDEQWSVELGAGYALSSQTNLAEDAALSVVRSSPITTNKTVDDFEDLWQLTWNATLVARWSPLYGKLNVAAELPVHFNAYLLAGGGVGGMERDSLVYCMGSPSSQSRNRYTCSAELGEVADNLAPLHDSTVKPVFVGGAGLRFYLAQWAGVRLEVRDVVFPDEYLVNITRALAEKDTLSSGATQGKPASNPGLTHLVFLDLGVTFTF